MNIPESSVLFEFTDEERNDSFTQLYNRLFLYLQAVNSFFKCGISTIGNNCLEITVDSNFFRNNIDEFNSLFTKHLNREDLLLSLLSAIETENQDQYRKLLIELGEAIKIYLPSIEVSNIDKNTLIELHEEVIKKLPNLEIDEKVLDILNNNRDDRLFRKILARLEKDKKIDLICMIRGGLHIPFFVDKINDNKILELHNESILDPYQKLGEQELGKIKTLYEDAIEKWNSKSPISELYIRELFNHRFPPFMDFTAPFVQSQRNLATIEFDVIISRLRQYINNGRK